jgi:hypothetical protein
LIVTQDILFKRRGELLEMRISQFDHHIAIGFICEAVFPGRCELAGIEINIGEPGFLLLKFI